MENNAVLRRMRYVLNIDDAAMCGIFALGGCSVSEAALLSYLKKDDEDGWKGCPDETLIAFLNGLIIEKRGPREAGKPVVSELSIDNNMILKKLRIAFNMREEDMINTFAKAGFSISASELGAFFRREGHKNFRKCGDQVLRNFLKGLSV